MRDWYHWPSYFAGWAAGVFGTLLGVWLVHLWIR